MSALPNAVAQAAAATAFVPAIVVQSLSEHSRPIRLLSSVVTVLAAGWLFGELPSTRLARALGTVLAPAGNWPALKVEPNSVGCSAGVLAASLQYWIANCATPIWFEEEKPSSVGSVG